MQLAQPDKYQTFHDKLYAHQGPLADEAQVKAIATAAGVDWSKVEAKFKDGSIDQNLGTNRALAEAMSISGTPAFIIGDQILRGAPRDLASLQAIVKDVRAGKSIQ
ncbi:DSBA-like thioredoxin domain protein [compost metagenome]